MRGNGKVRRVLDKVVERLKDEYGPERIILFGSYAYGEPEGESDIDLLIVKDTTQPFHKRWAEVCRIISPLRKGFAFSPFVVTPEELESRLEMGDDFFQEIISRGEVLYAR